MSDVMQVRPANYPPRPSLEVRPGLAADRSPGAFARLAHLVEDGADCAGTVGDPGIGLRGHRRGTVGGSAASMWIGLALRS